MAEFDLQNNIDVLDVLGAEAITDNTAQVGAIIDGANHRGLVYAIRVGTLADADATFTVLLEEGDASNLSDAAAVADADMVGTESGVAFTFTNDDEVRSLGYIGSKRYTRMTITPAANSGAATFAVVAITAAHRKSPQSSQE
jgi:hypothetical protein